MGSGNPFNLCWTGNDELPANLELVWDLLLYLNVHKSTGPNFSMILGVWRGPVDWKPANIFPILKKCKKEDPCLTDKPVSLTSVPCKIVENFIPGVTENHSRDNAIIGHSQHGFTRGKSCLINLIFFYYKVTCSWRREVSRCGSFGF